MNRRTAIRQVVFISAGTILFSSCNTEDNKSSLGLKNLSLSLPQEKLVAELSQLIIPKTNLFIGASDLRSHEFVFTMVDDCCSPEDQKIFIQGLKDFDNECKKSVGYFFTTCDIRQKNKWVAAVEKEAAISKDAIWFYKTVRKYTVQSFTSSKEYMTTVKDYRMIPGNHFRGCVLIS